MKTLQTEEYRARYPSLPQSVRVAREGIVEFARRWLDDESLWDVGFAVGEALANAVEHGHIEGGEIAIVCQFEHEQLSVEISDNGPGFSGWDAPNELPPASHASRGRGRWIMRGLVDKLEYVPGGSTCRLLKKARKR